MSAEEIAGLDFAALAAFWRSELGGKIRGQTGGVRRELAFTARFTAGELAEVTGRNTALGDEFIVVQGVADLAVILETEIWLVDFKTDDVSGARLAEKVRDYTPQLKLYGLALARIYGRPVTQCWLHFLSARRTESVAV